MVWLLRISTIEPAACFETCLEPGNSKTLTISRFSPRMISISSPAFTSFDAFAASPFTMIRPASQSCLATERRRTSRLALRKRSRRTIRKSYPESLMEIDATSKECRPTLFLFLILWFFGVLVSRVFCRTLFLRSCFVNTIFPIVRKKQWRDDRAIGFTDLDVRVLS